jgi:hypothetical protein
MDTSGDVTFVEFPTQSPSAAAGIATIGPSAGCGRTRGSRVAPGTPASMIGESPK